MRFFLFVALESTRLSTEDLDLSLVLIIYKVAFFLFLLSDYNILDIIIC